MTEHINSIHEWKVFKTQITSFQNDPMQVLKTPKHNLDIGFHSLIGQLPAGPCLVTDHGMSCLRIPLFGVDVLTASLHLSYFGSRLFHAQGRPFCLLHLCQTSMGQKEVVNQQ